MSLQDAVRNPRIDRQRKNQRAHFLRQDYGLAIRPGMHYCFGAMRKTIIMLGVSAVALNLAFAETKKAQSGSNPAQNAASPSIAEGKETLAVSGMV